MIRLSVRLVTVEYAKVYDFVAEQQNIASI
jgi:hypothetical protein